MPLSSKTHLRVRYSDTDPMGVAHHSAHVVWLENARTDFCREAGFSYAEVEAAGVGLAVVEILCRYRAPARFEDELAVITELADARRKRIEFRYRVEKVSDGTLVAEGSTVHVPIGRDGRACELPERFLEALEKAL